jgi:FkbM family methyltransferase
LDGTGYSAGVKSLLKRLATWLPVRAQRSLRRAYVRRRFRQGRFKSREREYHILDQLVRPKDWVLDIGANFGVYTARFSQLVGPEGRVIAMEPVPQTFDVLNALVQELPLRNVTLLNVACFEKSSALPLRIPSDGLGSENLYESTLDASADGPVALCLSVDSLQLPKRIAVVKIDVEGSELEILRGMRATLARDLPILIVEWMPGIDRIIEYLEPFGYTVSSRSGKGLTPEGFEQQNYVFRADTGSTPARPLGA